MVTLARFKIKNDMNEVMTISIERKKKNVILHSSFIFNSN